MHPAPVQIFESFSEQDTIAIAGKLALALRGGEYISLEGDLGAGKTFFARALAQAIGVTESVTSPTFVIQKIYSVNGTGPVRQFVHYDFYRIGSYHELIDLGFEDHQDDAVVLAEWGNLFIDDFPVKPICIQFEIGRDDSRLIKVSNLSVL